MLSLEILANHELRPKESLKYQLKSVADETFTRHTDGIYYNSVGFSVHNMPPPPPPPPPPPSGPPPSRSGIGAKSSNNAIPTDRNALLGEIQKGMRLKKTVTNDRSAPALGSNKNSSTKKYNTIGVHTHRQQQPQPPGPALWRRGSQDGSLILAHYFTLHVTHGFSDY
ncbi:WIPF [Acanthosepion pharaonis]|uniref:WIPF n=1 Tax=Acanthosepion pharaonis TaxID=158019 RepID=A0A812D2N0_ACAPH|nr:WIPF [Sepia pharaonis]